jgi:hypothetical protein
MQYAAGGEQRLASAASRSSIGPAYVHRKRLARLTQVCGNSDCSMRTEAGKRPDFSPTSPRDEEYHQLKYLPRSNLVWATRTKI